MRKAPMLGVVVVALTAAAAAAGASGKSSGTLQVDATLITTRSSNEAYCPPGTSANSSCFRYVGEGSISGLGRVTSTYTKVITRGDGDCEVLLLSPTVIEVPGKGTLELSRPGKTCWRLSLPVTIGPLDFIVTGGSGTYAGATGSVTFKTTVFVKLEGVRGASRDTWTGTLAAPGVDFDLTPPGISGAKTVRAPKRAKRVRVQYSVIAQDAADGSVPVFCEPRSDSFFQLGRTSVTCTATDTSGNTGRARFTVTVARRRA
jgi:HYR domain